MKEMFGHMFGRPKEPLVLTAPLQIDDPRFAILPQILDALKKRIKTQIILDAPKVVDAQTGDALLNLARNARHRGNTEIQFAPLNPRE